MLVPDDPKIFHITHIDNLPRILAAGCLWSDARRVRMGLEVHNIGYLHIKARRRERPVGEVAAGGKLGDYVPFNFCPRSVMLYKVHRGHDDYRAGQDGIVHLVSTARTAVATGRPCAFTDRHADVRYAAYYDDFADLGKVDWGVMHRKYWNEDEISELRQAEFLVHDWFRWDAFLEIGVIDEAMADRVRSLLGSSVRGPTVNVQPQWYY